jgi:hypothetical protein
MFSLALSVFLLININFEYCVTQTPPLVTTERPIFNTTSSRPLPSINTLSTTQSVTTTQSTTSSSSLQTPTTTSEITTTVKPDICADIISGIIYENIHF